MVTGIKNKTVVAEANRQILMFRFRAFTSTTTPFHRYVVSTFLTALGCAAILLTAAIPAAAQENVTTSMYDNQRTSVNSHESILTPTNVNSTNFGKLFSQSVDGYVYAQPLYVSNITIGGATHNFVYVATEHDSVYAFDADSNTGANAQPLWHTSFLSSGVTTVSASTVNAQCPDINPEYGITGTPVIDLSTKTLYVVADTLENNGTSYVMKLHALDITTGAEKPGSPTSISASVTVPGQNPVTFDAEWQLNRPGLLLYNGAVYIGFGSHCDLSDWRGWILGYSYNGSSFSQVFVFSTEPSSANGQGGGIWMAGQGLPMDAGSNLFEASGNGAFSTNVTPPTNYGDSIARIDLSNGPVVQDYFTPDNQSSLDANYQDLGSGGIAILPDQSGPHPHLLVQAGKDGLIHVIDRDNMGHFNSSTDKIVQELSGVQSVFGSPVYFNEKVYFWAASDALKVFTVTNGLLSGSPTAAGGDYFSFPGATPTISANGTSNGILWALNSGAYSDSGPGGPAVLYAYDVSDPLTLLYTSNQNATRDNPGGAIKFSVPTVANGKVYVGAEGQLSVFGERAGVAAAITSANNAALAAGSAGSFTVTATGIPTPSLTETGALPGGVTFVDNGNGTATLGGTPASGTGGTYSLTFTATNGVGAPASQSFTLTVNTVQAPGITSATSTTFTVGTAGSFTVTATGSPTPSLTATGTVPSGVTFVNNGNGTATLSGTPASGTGGTYALTFTASNGVGTPARQNFTLTANQAPAITGVNSTTFTVGTAGSFTVTATGMPVPSLTEAGALPSGLRFVNNGNGTATLSGTPASGTGGTYALTFAAGNGVGTAATQGFTLTVISPQGSYTTSFPLTENPISEGGEWINGRAVGLDWHDVRTNGTQAYGTQSRFTSSTDSIAVLVGNWGNDQTATATVHTINQQSGSIFEEVELLLRFSIGAHSAAGYEVSFSCRQDGSQYARIVRWDGPVGNTTLLDSRTGPGLNDGDQVKAWDPLESTCRHASLSIL